MTGNEKGHRESTVQSAQEIGGELDSPRVRHSESASDFGIDDIRIRRISAQDRQRFLEFFRGLSPATNALRFLALKKQLSDEELIYLTEPDGTRHVALVAVLTENGRERIVGAARFIVLPDSAGGNDHAELAVTVADEFQGKGIGARLVLHLIPLARRHSVRVFDLYASTRNTRIWRMVKRLAPQAARVVEGAVFHITFPLP